MLGILLIPRENGRTMRTYGLKSLDIYNMKFTFLCVVIAVSCNVCASGSREIYPGFKFDLSPDQQSHRLEDSEEKPYYQPNYRLWPSRKEALDLELSEQIRQFLLEKQKNEDNPPIYYTPLLQDDVYGDERSSSYNRYPNSQILDDVRPYPHEDDFTFGEDDQSKEIKILDPMDEISSKDSLSEAEIVEDPSQFAYPPTDVRFFQNIESPKTDNADGIPQPSLDKLKNNKIYVTNRNDEAFSKAVDQTTKEFDDGDQQLDVVIRPQVAGNGNVGIYIIAVVAGISAAATVGLIAVGIGWYNLQKHVKNASDVEYPAYGVTGPNKDISPSGDRRLAQSAQMYHYQHQKQQIIAMESRAAAGDRHGSVSEADSDEENEEGDYTVYECPGLAPTGEMEIKNPLFQDDTTPAQTPSIKHTDEKK